MKNFTLKVCFVLDCTASMGTWIDAAKNKILDLLEDLCEKNKNFKIYAAFIGYRDFGEETYKIDFTDDHMKIHTTLVSIDALGGDDIAEDVAGAYKWVTSLDWSADVKAVFHIADAPNHGTAYHDGHLEDNYPNGHPTIDLYEEVSKLAKQKIDLTVFRLDRSTDTMYAIMKDIYRDYQPDGFRIVNFMRSNVNEHTSFYSEVSSQLKYSMSTCDPTD